MYVRSHPATGSDSTLLVKEGRQILFVIRLDCSVLALFSFKPGQFLSETSILTQ